MNAGLISTTSDSPKEQAGEVKHEQDRARGGFIDLRPGHDHMSARSRDRTQVWAEPGHLGGHLGRLAMFEWIRAF